MSGDRAGALLKAHDALGQRGFRRDSGARGRAFYRGELDPTSLRVPVTLELADLDFIDPPPIWIDPSYEIADRKLPHLLGAQRSLCYLARGSVILDRYNPGGTVLQCLNQAETVVRDAIRGRLDADFADEFHAYWTQAFCLVDLPQDHVGIATVRYVAVERSGAKTPVLSTGASWLHDRNRGPRPRRKQEGERAVVVKVEEPLSLDPNGPWPPTNLGALNVWLQWAAPSVLGAAEQAVRAGSENSGHLLIRAPNGLFMCRLIIPERFRKPEFLKTRRAQLPRLLGQVASDVKIDRVHGVRADTDYIFGRNVGGMKNLADRRILLIGCGTIGGFLAQQLAQCGAGAGAGFLSLVDSEDLKPGNLGRHLLGVPYLHANKAQGCAAFLREQLPPLAIETYAGDVFEQDIPWSRYDLVIDATGEEALSIAFNERAVRARPNYPPHLFVWLEGAGAIAQAILTGEEDFACLKCLKPKLAGPPRFRTIRPDVSAETISNYSCGDAAYAPFPVTRSVSAAALACDMALDWANGVHGDRFRSLTFDERKAFQVRNGSPDRSIGCPACG